MSHNLDSHSSGHALSAKPLWQRPKLRTDEDEHRERKVSWIELFFDLVYVVIISQLAHSLSGHVSWEGLFQYVLLFMPAWWMWVGVTIYTERFETEDLSHRLATFLQMLPACAMAVCIHGGTHENANSYVLSYVVGRVMLILLWLRGGYYDPPARPVTSRFAVGCFLSVAVFLGSLWVAAPLKFALWGLALAIDFVTPLFTAAHQMKLPRLSTSRLPERFGLFVLIVLGESVVGTVNGLAQVHLTLFAGMAGVFGIALAFEIWSIYFDKVAHRRARPGIRWQMLRSYLHLPFVIAITAIGAGVVHVIGHAERTLPDNIRGLIGGATSATLLTFYCLFWVLRYEPWEDAKISRIRFCTLLSTALCAALTLFGAGMGALVFLSSLVLIVAALIAYSFV